MTFAIEGFKEQFALGGARPNLFSIDVSGMAQKLSFTARAASIPAQTVGLIEVPYFGRKVKVAGDRTFAEWTITILNDEDWGIRQQFEDWNYLINSHEPNVRSSDHYNILPGKEYKKTATVIHYDKKGMEIAKYQLIGAYPSDISAIDLAWDTNDTIEEFTVTLQYDYWTRTSPTGSATPAHDMGSPTESQDPDRKSWPDKGSRGGGSTDPTLA